VKTPHFSFVISEAFSATAGGIDAVPAFRDLRVASHNPFVTVDRQSTHVPKTSKRRARGGCERLILRGTVFVDEGKVVEVEEEVRSVQEVNL
jgi:hypothetical protein